MYRSRSRKELILKMNGDLREIYEKSIFKVFKTTFAILVFVKNGVGFLKMFKLKWSNQMNLILCNFMIL